ncbi:hypothetical protein [Streptosporangium sp. V21-05]|uniref:hypothetical protein n=1 Tax=Streptosporangium sp. V21-05 TaxID=3446115 RepID=UPI003F52C785
MSRPVGEFEQAAERPPASAVDGRADPGVFEVGSQVRSSPSGIPYRRKAGAVREGEVRGPLRRMP